MRLTLLFGMLFLAACSGSAPSPVPSPAPPAPKGGDTTHTGDPSGTEKGHPAASAAAGGMPDEWNATHDAGACPVNPAAMWDTAPEMTSICQDTDPTCIVCPQCTDAAGKMLEAYVIADYPRACGCPTPPNGPETNCGAH